MNLSTPAAPPNTFFAMLDGNSAGPFSEQELSRLMIEGKVVKTIYVWRLGLAKWLWVDEVPEALRLYALCPPPFSP